MEITKGHFGRGYFIRPFLSFYTSRWWAKHLSRWRFWASCLFQCAFGHLPICLFCARWRAAPDRIYRCRQDRQSHRLSRYRSASSRGTSLRLEHHLKVSFGLLNLDSYTIYDKLTLKIREITIRYFLWQKKKKMFKNFRFYFALEATAHRVFQCSTESLSECFADFNKTTKETKNDPSFVGISLDFWLWRRDMVVFSHVEVGENPRLAPPALHGSTWLLESLAAGKGQIYGRRVFWKV